MSMPIELYQVKSYAIIAVYGLKPASRCWQRLLVARLKSLGFEQSLADPCVFRLIEAGSASVIAVVHVDDIISR